MLKMVCINSCHIHFKYIDAASTCFHETYFLMTPTLDESCMSFTFPYFLLYKSFSLIDISGNDVSLGSL